MRASGRQGFSLIEVVIAILVLAVGVVGMAGTTAYVVRQVTLGEVATKRSAAVQTIVEGLRSTEYTNISSGAATVGDYSMTWTATPGSRTTTVVIISSGPGLVSVPGSLPILSSSAVDTFTYKVIRP